MPSIETGDNRFYIAGEGRELAEITYVPDQEGDLVINRTFVSEELRGQGSGEQLVRAVVDKARAEGLKIVPQCPYAAHQFEKHEEYKDVLKA